ncbi:MAG: 3-hydroxybutyryl-CoA dehydrogenase, partial [bacterium]|nr:3-hydroxybutyryl-CoA dehydrogenase [bacterium]
MSIKTIGIIGAGQMGSGIAYVAALNRFRVILNDLQPELVQKGAQTIST